MATKKIDFQKKPSVQNVNTFVENWVTGSAESDALCLQRKVKRTTIYLPEELHKKLKIKAANNTTSMTEIIIEILEKSI